MKVYKYDGDTKKYIGEVACQIDPLESKALGYNVYLRPANSTDVEPLPPKEGFNVVWDGDGWKYQEIEKDEPEPYTPTEFEKINEKILNTMYQLEQLDYIGIKIATGRATADEYRDEIERMNQLAEELNELRQQLAELGE